MSEPPKTASAEYPLTASRADIHRERAHLATQAESARRSGNAADLLDLLIAEIELWTRELKVETLELFGDTESGHFARDMIRSAPPELSILPGFILFPFITWHDAFDLVELIASEQQATALSRRFNAFGELRSHFGQAVSDLARVWDENTGSHLEELVTIDRHRSELKHAAMDFCRYVDTIANLIRSQNGPAIPKVSSLGARRSESSKVENRLGSLRHTFEQATKRLEALPDIELSPTGKPFIEECAQAMLAFAAWFGEQTPDDVSLLGNAHRVYYALGGLSGVIDWVALHRSVPFANELENEVAELTKEADAFDQACAQAFKVATSEHQEQYVRRPLSDKVYGDLEDRIVVIAGLAERLGRRLRRVAVWVGEEPAAQDVESLPSVHRQTEDNRPNGVYGPRTIVWQGAAHQCDLSKTQTDFLDLALRKDEEIDVNELMNAKSGLIWKTRYINSKKNRDAISKFLSRLNTRLLDTQPPIRFTFRLLRDRDYIVRSDPPATGC